MMSEKTHIIQAVKMTKTAFCIAMTTGQ